MAKNYSFGEVVKIVTANKDMEALQDIGRRYPLLLMKVTAIVAKSGNSFADLAGFFPEHLTANKVNTGIKSGVTSEDSDSDEEDEETDAEDLAPTVKTSPAKTAPKTEEKGYAQQTGDALIAICKERKLAWKGLKKLQLIEVLELDDAAGSAKPTTKPAKSKAIVEEVEDDEVEDAGYSEKTAIELFKEAKARGLKVEPKKPAKYYITLLEKDDAAKEVEDEVEEEETWEDEEEAAPVKPAKPSAKPAAKPAKEEEEWDL